MPQMPTLGEPVYVWPHPGERVRSHDPAIADRYLPPEGQSLPWTTWLQELHGQGHVHLTDPRPGPKSIPVVLPPSRVEVK